MDQRKLEEVHKVHADMEALAKQKLVELESRNLSNYNLTQEDFGLSNTTLTLLDIVLTEMDSLLSQINASHLADEQLLLALAEGFVQCNTDLAARQVESNSLSALVNDTSDSHDSCRSTEQSLSAQNSSAWAAYLSKANESQPQEVLDCLQNFQSGYSSQTIEHTLAHLQAIIDCATTLQSWSTAFVANVTGLRDTYFDSLHAVNNHSEDCRVNQSTLESHFCEYRQQLTDSCLAMDTCYRNVNETFHELLVTIATSGSRREASFIAATKVICYIQVLKTNLTQPAVQACQDLVVDTSGIDVDIPVPATKQTCDTSPVADYPCNASWQQEEYFDKSWYTGTPQIEPDTCIPCAVWNAGNVWTELTVANAPAVFGATVTEGPAGKIYHLGGESSTGVFDAMHTFEKNASGWQLSVVSGLDVGPRSGHTSVRDRWAGSLLIYGGWSGAQVLRDLWTFRWNGTFEKISEGPHRSGHSSVWAGPWDGSAAGPMLVFGGLNEGFTYMNEVWQFENSTWSQVSTSGNPSARAYHTAVFAESLGSAGLMLVYGGHSGSSRLDDFWAYDHAAKSWSPLQTGMGTRSHASAVWNPMRQAMLVFGGFSGSDEANDLLEWHNATWNTVIPIGSVPGQRWGHCATWVESEEAMIVVGGRKGASYYGDVWLYEPR
ncbi:GPA3 [Symbiodinium natans]|uniref:GPA3 protein n=1 Tax=Symbiodinium natans TaxID=878477 RepID=A0A812UIZ8_9DINO|nr:GPA3 [Symbiodinium natans]